ncbi:MAG: hypothetical protein N2200_01330 [Bacteroidia bacterium]|nr:hypothetical protein [Bacteroidia bacterium]
MENHSLADSGFQPIKPESRFYFLQPKGQGLGAYNKWQSISDIFPTYSVGIVTARDSFAIAFSRDELMRRIHQFREKNLPDAIIAQTYGVQDTQAWSLSEARDAIRRDPNAEHKIYPILYRPFDQRFILYHKAIIERPRYKVMRHMLAGENMGIVVTRQVKTSETWQHALVADRIIESCYVSNKTSEIGYLFPLYRHSSSKDKLSLGVESNIGPNIDQLLQNTYGDIFTPERLLAYIYAILYAPMYRNKYVEALCVDFPRIPFPQERQVFERLAELGQRLIDLHLLRCEPPPASIKYEGEGSDTIDTPFYDETQQRLYLKKPRKGEPARYFTGITPELWNYEIGGYKVLPKYLKARKGRRLEDPIYFLRIARALAETIHVQQQIDKVYPQVEAALLAMQLTNG